MSVLKKLKFMKLIKTESAVRHVLGHGCEEYCYPACSDGKV